MTYLYMILIGVSMAACLLGLMMTVAWLSCENRHRETK